MSMHEQHKRTQRKESPGAAVECAESLIQAARGFRCSGAACAPWRESRFAWAREISETAHCGLWARAAPQQVRGSLTRSGRGVEEARGSMKLNRGGWLLACWRAGKKP